MDAVEYLKERTRMCRSIISCTDCPFDETQSGHDMDCGAFTMYHPEEAVRIVEKWSKEHPIKTNAQKFEEVFGKPVVADAVGHRCAPWQVRCATCECDECDEWWDEPYKAPEE